MSSSKAKEPAQEGSSTHGPQGIKKSKPKKKSIAEVRAEREAIKEKIRIGEENLQKANGGEAMDIDQINAELDINRSTLQALDEEGDTPMPEEAGNGASADSTPDVIITRSQGNNEPDIKQEDQEAGIALTSIEAHGDVEDLVGPDDILDQDTTTDGKPIGWRPGGRGRDMVMVEWGPPNARVYKEISMKYCPPPFSKDSLPCLSDERVGDQKHKGVYEYGRGNRPILQGVAFAYPSTEEHPEKFLHPDTKGKRYVPGSYLIKWTEGSGMSFRTWETRTTVRRIWGGSPKRADLAILEGFLKAQTRYNEWKKGQRGSEDRSPTPNSTLQAPLVTPSPSPQSITTPSAATTSLTVPTPSPGPAQSVPTAQPVTAQVGATEQPVPGATQQPVPGATQQPVPGPTQLPTPGATPQPTTEITSPPEKKQVTDQEKETEARRAFMAVMFDGMGVEGKPTESQQIKVAMLWAQKKIEILTN